MKRHPILMFATILAVAALACGQFAPAAPPPPDPNAVNTSIAQTIAAAQTEAVLANPPTATFTAAAVLPSPTLEPTLSATPQFTATLETPLITVSVDTNCRVGPDPVFARVGMLLAGETAEVVGREPKGEFWYIRNPDEGAEFCWVSGKYGTVTGNLLPLLYLSPAPPPASSFSVTFEGLNRCENTWWADFKLVNASGALFRSVSLVMRDPETVTVATMQSNGFTNKDGCDVTTTAESLVGGGTLTVSSSAFGYNPAGNNLGARIKLCTEPDLAGTCVERELIFRP